MFNAWAFCRTVVALPEMICSHPLMRLGQRLLSQPDATSLKSCFDTLRRNAAPGYCSRNKFNPIRNEEAAAAQLLPGR